MIFKGKKILKVYEGKKGCACGCNGNYYTVPGAEGRLAELNYPPTPTDRDKSIEVINALRKFDAMGMAPDDVGNGFWLDISDDLVLAAVYG